MLVDSEKDRLNSINYQLMTTMFQESMQAKWHTWEHYIIDVIYGGRPVILRYFPMEVKAFYIPVIKSETCDRVNGYDLLTPYIDEVVGGSQIINRSCG